MPTMLHRSQPLMTQATHNPWHCARCLSHQPSYTREDFDTHLHPGQPVWLHYLARGRPQSTPGTVVTVNAKSVHVEIHAPIPEQGPWHVWQTITVPRRTQINGRRTKTYVSPLPRGAW